MDREPTIETRPDQPYVGVRAVMPMSDFSRQIPEMAAKASQWLDVRGLRPSGRPILRYHVVDMPERMDVELGLPLAEAVASDGQVRSDVLPAGRYAVLTYTGVKNALAANKELFHWIADQGEEAASRSSEGGEAFDSRFETYMTDLEAEPVQDRWETEVAVKLRD